MSRSSLGFLLHLRRKKLGLRQVAVAQSVGISQSALSKIERGSLEPGLMTAGRLYRLYGCRGTVWCTADYEIDFLDLYYELSRTPTPAEQSEIRSYWKSKAKRELREMREK